MSAISEAAWTVVWVRPSRIGSISVEFSGHRTKSGRRTSPNRARVIRLIVSDRWLLVTDRARPRASIPRPGTLPCTMPTWTAGPLPGQVGSTWNRVSAPPVPTRAITPAAASATARQGGRIA